MTDRATVPPSAPAAQAPAPAPAVDVSVAPMPGGQPSKGFGGRVTAMPQPAAPAQPAPEAQGDRPTWLPEKFKSPEDLARAYGELESRLGSAPVGKPEAAPGSDAGGGAGKTAGAQSPSAAAVAKIAQEYAASGKVSPETRKAFAEATGLDDHYIDQHMAHMRATEQRALDAANRRLGGPAAVQELLTWAGKRLSPEEQVAFNQAVVSDNPAMVQLAVDGLAAKYEMENGRSPRVIAGRKPQADLGGIQPFQSNDDWARARKDPRYKSDPAYRQEVEDRFRLGSELGLL